METQSLTLFEDLGVRKLKNDSDRFFFFRVVLLTLGIDI